MTATATHDWYLVGPWYGWSENLDADGVDAARAEDGGVDRTSRPILQKYATADFVNAFLADPQRSLTFHATRDTIAVDDERSVRKLYLTTHERFYLVVCALHCDAAGFPPVNRGQVTEAGFVVRRRAASIPEGVDRDAIESALRGKAKAMTRLQRLNKIQQARLNGNGIVRKTAATALVMGGGWTRTRGKILSQLDEAKTGVREVLKRSGVTPFIERWVPSEHEGFGAWVETEDEGPQEIDEQVYTLYPLIPDPTNDDHTSPRGSLWFGVVPTSGSAIDDRTLPQFDDRHLYEIRTFARRAKPHPSVPDETCPNGTVTWSEPTESYRLAGHYDLLGTSNKVTMVQLPDFPALKEHALGLEHGEGVGIGFMTPADSSLNFTTDPVTRLPVADTGDKGGFEICFFAIPLITIVAMFVLKIFLPIVMLIFGLWWMLLLKFCIPPSISLSFDVALELDVTPPSIEFDADLSLTVQGDFGFVDGDGNTISDLSGAIRPESEWAYMKPEEARRELQNGSLLELAQVVHGQGWNYTKGLPSELTEQMETSSHPDAVVSTPVELPSRTKNLAFYPTAYREGYLEVPDGAAVTV